MYLIRLQWNFNKGITRQKIMEPVSETALSLDYLKELI